MSSIKNVSRERVEQIEYDARELRDSNLEKVARRELRERGEEL